MSTALQKASENKKGVPQPIKATIYTEFILWTAMPSIEKRELGIESQRQFAAFHHVNEDTLSLWKQRIDFEERVDKILKMWSVGKTPDVVHSIYKAAIKGNPMSQMLWLQYFKGFSSKGESATVTRVEVGPNDVRRIIELLPEPYRTKYHGYITEIVTTANAIKNARGTDDAGWSTPVERNDGGEHVEPAKDIRDAAYHDASELPRAETDAVAARHPQCLRTNMVGELSPHHHKSPSWWW